jgi:hypothetical protein
MLLGLTLKVLSGRSDHPEGGTIGWAQNMPLTDNCYTYFVVKFLKSSLFGAKPPVFCKHAARTIIKIKNEDAIKKSENLCDTCP